MAVTVASFRAVFAEFASAESYPDQRLAYWLALGEKMINVERWGDLADHGAMLFTAHRVTLQARSLRDAKFGKAPGSASGPVSSKSVDKVSISYDVSSSSEEGAGFWNLTTYGQEYIRLARIMGTGPIEVGASMSGPSASAHYNAFAIGPNLG
jgi:Protein of unknown function (DUF4054)